MRLKNYALGLPLGLSQNYALGSAASLVEELLTASPTQDSGGQSRRSRQVLCCRCPAQRRPARRQRPGLRSRCAKPTSKRCGRETAPRRAPPASPAAPMPCHTRRGHAGCGCRLSVPGTDPAPARRPRRDRIPSTRSGTPRAALQPYSPCGQSCRLRPRAEPPLGARGPDNAPPSPPRVSIDVPYRNVLLQMYEESANKQNEIYSLFDPFIKINPTPPPYGRRGRDVLG